MPESFIANDAMISIVKYRRCKAASGNGARPSAHVPDKLEGVLPMLPPRTVQPLGVNS